MALIMVVSFDGGAVVVSFDGGVADTTIVLSSNNGVLISNIAWGMVASCTSWVVVVIGGTHTPIFLGSKELKCME